jgi:hypothetical protein
MYMSNFVLGVFFAKANRVRRKDIFLDGILAGMVKNPAMGLVLVTALSPNQRRHPRLAAPVINTASISSTGTTTKVTITGLNFGLASVGGATTGVGASAPATASVTFQYVDGAVANTSVFPGQTVTGTAPNQTIVVDLTKSDQMQGILDAVTDPNAGVFATVTANSVASVPARLTSGS